MVRTSEASWRSPVNIKNSLNTTFRLQCHCTPLAPLCRKKEMLGGDVKSQGKSSALHSPGIENASMPSTPSKKHCTMPQSWLYQTPKPNISYMSMLASMHSAQCSPRCKTRQRMYWVISAVNYIMRRGDNLHVTENHWASETQYYTGNSTYTQVGNHFWYTQNMQPFVGSSNNHTLPYDRWIS